MRNAIVPLAAVLLLSVVTASSAAIVIYTDAADFAVAAGPHTVVDFDSDPAGDPIAAGIYLDQQYASVGVDFDDLYSGRPHTSGALTGMGPLSGANFMKTRFTSNGAGGFAATFSAPVHAFGIAVGDLQPGLDTTTLELFDTVGDPLSSFDLGTQLGAGPLAWHFFGVTSDTVIGKIQIGISVNNYQDLVLFDDMRFAGGAVPEPSSVIVWTLIGLIGGVVLHRRRKAG